MFAFAAYHAGMDMRSTLCPEALQDSLALIALAPPQVHADLPRVARLHLQSRLLASLPRRAPAQRFRVCWRTVFSWGPSAQVACGEVRWEADDGDRHASFAVDVRRCTLTVPGTPDVALLAAHLSATISTGEPDDGCSLSETAMPASAASRSAQVRM